MNRWKRKKLQEAYDLIKDPTSWTAGSVARSGNGDFVDARDAKAMRWCALGAVQRVTFLLHQTVLTRTLDEKAKEMYGFSIVGVNDHFGYGHKAVLAVFEALLGIEPDIKVDLPDFTKGDLPDDFIRVMEEEDIGVEVSTVNA